MEKVDLSRPGREPAALDRRRRRDRGGRALELAFPRMLRAARGRAAAAPASAALQRPGGGARAGRPRPPRRGQPVADRRCCCGSRRPREARAARARGRARRDQRARQPGDARAARRSPASCARPRSTTSASTAALAGQVEQLGARPGSTPSFEAEGDSRRPRRRRPAGRLPGRPGGARPTRPATRAPSTSRSACAAPATASSCAVSRRRPRLRLRPSPSEGLGIAGMRERALLVGGELTIESAPGAGTRVTLRARCRWRRRAHAIESGGGDEGPDRRRPRDRPLRAAAAARAPARHRGGRPRPPTASRRATWRSASGPTWRSSTSRCRS